MLEPRRAPAQACGFCYLAVELEPVREPSNCAICGNRDDGCRPEREQDARRVVHG
jgi:hypothetical protein